MIEDPPGGSADILRNDDVEGMKLSREILDDFFNSALNIDDTLHYKVGRRLNSSQSQVSMN